MPYDTTMTAEMQTYSTSSDEDAPETFSFSVSKRNAKGEARALEQFQAREKRKLKERRRERDRVLKGQKEKAKEKEKALGHTERDKALDEPEGDGLPSKSALEARMQRAMQEAESEFDDDESELRQEEANVGEVGAEEEHAGPSGDGMHTAESSHEDVDMGSYDDESGHSDFEATTASSSSNTLSRSQHRPKPDYLPEHLFASAFSQLTSASSSTKQKPNARSKAQEKARLGHKRKRHGRGMQDVISG